MDGIEAFGLFFGDVEHLEGADGKTFFLDALDDLADGFFLDRVGFNNG